MPVDSALDHHDQPRARVPWWAAALGLAFCGYYALLLTADLTRPEPLGFVAAIERDGFRLRMVAPGSPAARAGLQPGDLIVGAGGRALGQRLDWTAVAVNMRNGQPLSLAIVRGDAVQAATLTPVRAPWTYWTTAPALTLLSARGVQLVALILALVVVFRRPGDRAARIGAWLLASMAVFSIDWQYQLAAHWRVLPLPASAVLWLPFASSLAVPAILFTFFATFPRPVVGARWLAAAWAPAIGLAGIQLAFMMRAVHAPARDVPLFDWTLTHGLAVAAYGLGAVAVLAAGYGRLTDITERRRVRFLVLGSVVGLLSLMPAVSLYWSRSATAVGDSFFATPAAAVATLLGLALPISFAYAILRHRLFSVGYLIRAGLQYALARSVLVSLVPAALVIGLADLWIHREAPVGKVLGARGWGYLALAGLALGARLRRDTWLEALDRRFFRERYNAERLLRSVGEDVRAAPGIDAVASSVVAKIEAALHPKVTALLVRTSGAETYRVAASAPVTAHIGALPAASRIAGLLHVLRTPLRVSAAGQARLLRELPPEDVAWLDQARAEMLVPVCDARATVLALMVLGRKRSQEPYSSGDEDLLMAIAHSLAARPAAAAPADVDDGFGECPQCGACYDAPARRCIEDAAGLAIVPDARLLAGRYRLERRIGRGGMGTVYEAFDTALGRRVAAKLLRDDVVDAIGGSVERFTTEARLAASLVHANVVTVHDIGVTRAGRAFFIMERLEGESLRELLRRSGRLPPARARRLLTGLCAAVDAAHRRNIIHRDLKPENVIICDGEEGETVKVLDFGLAKPLDTGDGVVRTQPGVIAGTLEYMSPEHLRGGDPSPDWDLWALGIIAVEMLTGTRPWPSSRAAGSEAETTSRLDMAPVASAAPAAADAPGTGALPSCFRQFVTRVLAPNPLERPESARELLAAFDAAVEASHELRT